MAPFAASKGNFSARCEDQRVTENVVSLVERPLYVMPQVDRILGLLPGTSRRWIDGYRRGDKTYPPVIREKRTEEETVTWGEFVETRLLSEYRDAGVPLVRMRPAVEALREELNTAYPLASARTWLSVSGKELVREVQEKVGLDSHLALVVVRTGQKLIWSRAADDFLKSVEWSSEADDAEPKVVRPFPDIREVEVDPLRGFGEPVIRGVPVEVLAELMRAGESTEMVAEQYELSQRQVEAALRYELRRAAAA